ncbi:hypothetical protein Tco_0905675 [Tanacetum coccineum]
MFECGSYKSHPEHVTLYEAHEASMERANRDELLAEKAKSRKRRHDDQDPPQAPPKDSDPNKKSRRESDALGSKQPLTPQSLAWKTFDTREAPSSSSKQKGHRYSTSSQNQDKADWFKPVPKDDMSASPEPDWIIPPNDLPEAENNWADALAKSYKDPQENKLLSKTGDMGSFIKWYCKRIGKKKLTKADLEGPAYMTIDLINPEGHRVVPDVSKLLPLGGPPGQVTIQPHFFFNRDLEYLVSSNKDRRNALSISKLKAARYLDFGLEELVLHSAPSDHHAVISHMRILNVTSLKTYERYGYTYPREIVLCRADYNEYKISESDFKNLYLDDFEDMYLLHLQGKLNHLPGFDKDALDFLLKEDYTIVSKPRAVIYRDRSDLKNTTRLNEEHKFSDGTLTRVLDKLDHMVKDFRLYQYNPGMESRIWSKDDKRRSEEFMEEIERRLKIRRIFKSLESFVSGRLRDVDYCNNPSFSQRISLAKIVILVM